MTGFGGLVQAGTALRTASYGLQIVQQNIANADTPGYTRQAVQQTAIDAVAGVPSIFARPTTAGGVDVSGTARLTDPVLAARLRTETSRSAASDTTAAGLSQIESVFPEPSDTGLSEQLNDYWNAWGSVANDPGSAAPRTVLLQKAGTVATTLNAMSTSLSDIAASTGQALGNDIADADTAASSLATINGQLAVAAATGANSNALADQRDLLLTKLATLVGGVATINANGSADVTVAGQSLVSGASSNGIAVTGTSVTVGGTGVTLASGSAGAETTALTTTIPDYQAKLDAVATALTTTTNAAQAAGFDAAGATGGPLFTATGAADIAVATTDPNAVAAASTPGGTLDGGNALAASALGTVSGGPDTVYTTLVADVGASSALAQHQQATQDAVTTNVGALMTSVSGVSTDEEVSAMLTYQHAYQASSRVLTTMDDMLDTLINHTGRVGQA